MNDLDEYWLIIDRRTRKMIELHFLNGSREVIGSLASAKAKWRKSNVRWIFPEQNISVLNALVCPFLFSRTANNINSWGFFERYQEGHGRKKHILLIRPEGEKKDPTRAFKEEEKSYLKRGRGRENPSVKNRIFLENLVLARGKTFVLSVRFDKKTTLKSTESIHKVWPHGRWGKGGNN